MRPRCASGTSPRATRLRRAGRRRRLRYSTTVAPPMPKLPARKPRPGRGRLDYVEAPSTTQLRFNSAAALVVLAIIALVVGLSIWLALD